MYRYKLHSPHLINVAALPCESRNTEKCNITVAYKQTKIASQLHQNGPVHYKIWGVMQKCMHKTKIRDIDDQRKCLTQTWFHFEQDVIDVTINQWRDRFRPCVHVGDRHFEHTL